MRRWIALLAIMSSPFVGFGQAPQPGQTGTPPATESTESEISTKDSDAAIKVEVNLVLVPVVVKDSSGNPVSGLRKEDFQIFDNGKAQTVSTFSVETAETRTGRGAAVSEAKPAEKEIEKGTSGVSGS